VNFGQGVNTSIIKDYGYYIRCVRGGHGLLLNLLISFAGTGNGTVTGSGIRSGESDSFASNENSSEYFDFDTSVNLNASPAEYSIFSGCTGACGSTANCTVLMDSDKSITATFNNDILHISSVPTLNTRLAVIAQQY